MCYQNSHTELFKRIRTKLSIMKHLKTAWKPYYINGEYVKGFPFPNSLNDEEKANLWLKEFALLLGKCLVYRIFSKETLKEVLFRMVVLENKVNSLEELTRLDNPLEFSFSEDDRKFTLADIFDHFGIEVYDALVDLAERTSFLASLESPGNKSGNSAGTGNVKIADTLIAAAASFADKAIELAPKGLYEDTKRFQDKIEEIKMRRYEVSCIPEFKLEEIPVEVRDKCMEIMFPDDYPIDYIDEVRSKQNKGEDFKRDEVRYMYLAWLYANNLILENYSELEVMEGVDFDFSQYQKEAEGLIHIFERHNIFDAAQLLKGYGFDK